MTESNGKTTNGNASSHLDWLRARHAALTADRSLDVEVPGYQGRLVLRCGPVPWPIVARMQRLVAAPDPQGDALLAAQSDILIAATREVLVRGESGGELVPIDPSGEARRIDPRLAELLVIESSTARRTLLGVFPSEIALGVTAGEVLEWSQLTTADADKVLLGE